MATCDGRQRLIAEKFSQLKVSYPLLNEANQGKEALNSFLANDKLARDLTCGKTCGEVETPLDLVSSPAPKFLTQLNSAGNPLPPFKPPAVVPFQWEEIPGKPKPYDSALRDDKHSLKLPPRLAVYSNSKPVTHHRASWKKMLVPYRDNFPAEPNLQEMDKTKKHRPSTGQRTSRSYTNISVPSSCSGNNRMSINKILSRAGYKSAANLSLTSFFKSFRSKSIYPKFSKPLLQVTNTSTPRTSKFVVAPKSEKPLLISRSVRSFKKPFFGRSQRGQKLQKVRGLADVEIWGPSLTTYLQRVKPMDAPSNKSFETREYNQSHICSLLEGLPSSKASKVQSGHHWTSKYSMNKDRIGQVEPLCDGNDSKNGRRRHLNLRMAASVYEILTCKWKRATLQTQKDSRSRCKLLGKSSC